MNITLISDTHDQHRYMPAEEFPHGDTIIHAGDWSMNGSVRDLGNFLTWFSTLPYANKIFISGNHDWCFDNANKVDAYKMLDNFKGVTYLQDESIIIDGIKIYGSPTTPRFHDWAFNKERGAAIAMEWEKIPHDTDILVTHGPPLNYGDRTIRGNRLVGCVDLLNTVIQIKPKLHIFGHIHEGRGIYSNNDTTFINASTLDEYYSTIHEPITINYNDFLTNYHEKK